MDIDRCITDDLSDIETSDLLDNLPNYFGNFGDFRNSAYLNWRFDSFTDLEVQFYNMGQAYFETSLALIDICLENNSNKKADIWIFPIMFNIVHGIEVYLKGFNSQYRIYEKLKKYEYEETKIEGKHNIKQICEVAIKLAKGNKDDHLLKELTFIKRFIDILYENTDDMAFARYPITQKKAKQFFVEDTENVAINLHVLKQWVTRVFRILDTCTDFIDIQIDQIKEWLYEMQQEYRDNF